jgi:hypothetical protein
MVSTPAYAGWGNIGVLMNRFKAIWEWRHYMKNFGWKQQSIPLKNISLRNTGAHGLQNSVPDRT